LSENLAIGKIRTSHGIKGEIKIFSFSGEYDHFFDLTEVTLKNGSFIKNFEIESIKMLDQTLLMKLKGISDPETVKKFNGFEIWVSRNHAAKLKPNEVYYSDLVGMELVFEGETKGKVIGVTESPTADMLEVELNNGDSVLVPFMERYIGEVDFQNRVLPLKVDWILD